MQPELHCRVHSSLPAVPVLSHIKPVHDLPSFFRSILKLSAHLYLVLPSGSYLQVSPQEGQPLESSRLVSGTNPHVKRLPLNGQTQMAWRLFRLLLLETLMAFRQPSVGRVAEWGSSCPIS